MKILSESRIHHPVDKVYRAYRDRLPEIARYIPDIKEVRVLGRQEVAGGVELHNLWVAQVELPRVVQGVIKPEMMQWHDYATWDDAQGHVDWRLVIPTFERQVTCAGRNSFHADGPQASRVVLTGDLDIHMTSVPGVPAFMAARLAPKVEEFIVRLISPNLRKVNESLETFLDDLG